MAKVFSSHPISGTIGHQVFYVRDGKTYARLLGRPTSRHATQPHQDARNNLRAANRQSFGGASLLAGKLFASLGSRGERHLLAPYGHNRIAKRVRARAHRVEGAAVERYAFPHARAALLGLDLGRPKAPAGAVSVSTVGPGHNPLSIRVHGLREAARAVPAHGNAHLQLRVRLHHAAFPEVYLDKADGEWRLARPGQRGGMGQFKSGWIPVEAIPEAPLELPCLRVDEGDPGAAPHLTLLLVEWREVREVDGSAAILRDHTLARVAALHCHPSQALEAAAAEAATPAPVPAADPRDLREAAMAAPEAFLAAALGGLAHAPPRG